MTGMRAAVLPLPACGEPPNACGALHGRAFVGAAGQFHEIDRRLIEPAHHLHGVRRLEAAFLEIGGVQLHRDTEARRDHGSHGPNHVEQQPRAVVQLAAPGIGAPVGQR